MNEPTCKEGYQLGGTLRSKESSQCYKVAKFSLLDTNGSTLKADLKQPGDPCHLESVRSDVSLGVCLACGAYYVCSKVD